jgi:U5 small nuclear ribonucleoprotein component
VCLPPVAPLTNSPGADRSFVTFILEPLYKLTSTVVGEHPKTIERVLGEEFGVYLKSSTYSQDVKPLLKQVRGMGAAQCCMFVSMLLKQRGSVCLHVSFPEGVGGGAILLTM